MDAGIDFIQPDFLNILFFQQKNLVIFPYIDLKHLHSLELFTVGYNVIDLESTAISNLKGIIEYDANNSYSQNPSLYFVYNLSKESIKEIMQIPNIRCILNSNEKIGDLAGGNNFIFYNKKNKKFQNYTEEDVDLSFEKMLISSSENETELHDKIQKIKTVSNRIFSEINQKGNLNRISEILGDYDEDHWPKILNFVKFYFKIEIPEIKQSKIIPKERIKSKGRNLEILREHSEEYELIVTLNNNLAKEFIQLLHKYRSQYVNPANLSLDQLYNPQKLYNYLRSHHWSTQISESFISEWIQMRNTGYALNGEDLNDLEKIFKFLGIPDDFITNILTKRNEKESAILEKPTIPTRKKIIEKETEIIPSIDDFPQFKTWILKKIEDIERLLNLN